MRRFLYYNQDSVNSYLAQIEKGLLQTQQASHSNEKSTSNDEELKSSVSGDLAAKFFSFGASLQGEISASSSDSEAISEISKNIHEKILHDFAFEKVYDYLSEKNKQHEGELEIGDIVLMNEVPTFLDFEYIQSLFSKDGIYKFMSEQEKAALEMQLTEIKQSIPKGAKIPPDIKSQITMLENQVRNAVKNSDNERRELERTFEAIRSALPYKRFIMTDDCLIPLVDDYFRDDPDIVAFKYGGKMSITGYITNVIINDTEKEYSNDIAPLFNMLNMAMMTLFKNKDKVFIVHPIALYY
ncbi:MAG: hypothetical protein FWF81_02860 [Defluviitaleaceae bacterium]|nr:hypothetical protein [Defluviitaleaceae bacterium]